MISRVKWILFLFALLSTSAEDASSSDHILNIAVIGGGAAGLASAKNILEQGHKVVIFEKSGALGGTWWYTDQIGKDEFGVDIHSAIYYTLRTNTPYQTLEFPDFPYPNNTRSYPSHEVVWKYLDSYARKFQIIEHIKLHHLVEKVTPIEDGKWNITVQNLPENRTETVIFDAVFVCSSVFSSPYYPYLAGAKEFNGTVMHSHDYRRPKLYEGENILVIGNGPSGKDVTNELAELGNQVTHSVRNSNRSVRRFIPPSQVEFEDGSVQTFHRVIYATGYKFSFPFLDKTSGISVEDFHVKSLYKYVLNIHYPTMAFIGIPSRAVHNRMFDLQARFALKYITGAKRFPTSTEMLSDENFQQIVLGNPKKPHMLFLRHSGYYEQLARAAQIENIPDIISDVFNDAIERQYTPGFRDYKYIIEGNTFRREIEQ